MGALLALTHNCADDLAVAMAYLHPLPDCRSDGGGAVGLSEGVPIPACAPVRPPASESVNRDRNDSDSGFITEGTECRHRVEGGLQVVECPSAGNDGLPDK
jgi:hypothetical protein